MTGFVGELRRRGVLGALIAYGVAAAGGLQLADIVTHAMDLPAWTMRLLIALAALGLPVTFAVSWFWDLTRHGFVRTQLPPERAPTPASPRGITPMTTQPTGAPVPIAPGVVLSGRYRIEKELGSGGMGRVFSALDTRLNRRVAVKVVLGAHEPSRIRRFEQEARTVGSLEHPNVLAVYDLGDDVGVPYLVTELLDGHTLRTVLKRGALPADQAMSLALQLARGLGAAHARGIIHRDLKPENLFVTSDGRLKILDFGLAKLVGDDHQEPGAGLTMTGAVFGTPGYIAPEQARGERATAATDVFAAGAVLYEILSGERAFPGNSLIEAGHAALTRDPPPLPPFVPASLDTVVRKTLAKDPRQRYPDGNALVHALEVPGSVAPTAVTTGVIASAPRTYRRSTVVVLAGAGLAIGAAIASAALVQHRERNPAREARQRGHIEIPGVPGGIDVPVPPVPPVPAEPARAGNDDDEEARKDERDRAADFAKLQNGLRGLMRAGEIGMASGVHALVHAGQYERADQMTREWLAKHPDSIYVRLQRAAALRRMGRKADAQREMQEFVNRAKDDEWPMPIARMYAGMLKPDDVEEIAEKLPGNKKSRLCELYYYAGLLKLTDTPPDVDAARDQFEEAASMKTNDIEASFAREELAQLEKQDK